MSSGGKRTDYYAGAFVAVIGAGAALISSHYRVGTLTSMGPGFFPVALGVLLAVMGVFIAMAASDMPTPTSPAHGPDKVGWDVRGWVCIIGAPLVFIFLAENVGFLPACFAAVLIAAAGDRTATVKASVLLAAGMTAFAIILFVYILHIEIPIIRGF
jgi:hypothetical protein